MNTTEIIGGCQEIPGVSMLQTAEYTELRLFSDEGEGTMRFYPVFPGVTLAQIQVRAPIWPVPELQRHTVEQNGPLLINYCSHGRCELRLNDNRSEFLTAGQIALTEKFARESYVYPGRAYEGIEIFVDPETALHGCPLLYEEFGVDIPAIRRKYCGEGGTYIAKLSLPDAVFHRLRARETDADGTCVEIRNVGRKTAVIELLTQLLVGETVSRMEKAVYYTRSQVEIARQTEQIVTAELSRQYTIHELAERFAVSESSLKNYFRGVFGQSIAQYVTARRMAAAGELLLDTRLSVLAVANRVGYENQSKFAAAFRRFHGCTPLEYRRRRHIAL